MHFLAPQDPAPSMAPATSNVPKKSSRKQDAGVAATQPLPVDFAAMHTTQPNYILKAFERQFVAHNPNFSAEVAPKPDDLVRPPPTPTVYWVVDAGEKVGLCHNPSDIDFSRILLLPRFSLTRFEDWKDAVAYYRELYKEGDIGLIKYVDFGTPEEPIAVRSNQPTPVPIKKKPQPAKPKAAPPAKPSGAQTRVVCNKAKKAPAVQHPSDSEDLYLPDPPSPTPAEPSGASTRVLRNKAPKAAPVDVPFDSDMNPPDAPSPRPVVVLLTESDDSDPVIGKKNPKADQQEAHPPITTRKRPFPLPIVHEDASIFLGQGAASSLKPDQGSPGPKANRPLKKARAISEPPRGDESAKDSGGKALFLPEEWLARGIKPLIFPGTKKSGPTITSATSFALAHTTFSSALASTSGLNRDAQEDEELDDDDEELPAYPYHSKCEQQKKAAKKGKGKAVDDGN